MKIGYPCVNEAMDCSSGNTFRLASYSDERLVAAVTANLTCLRRMLEWNVAQGLLFFRIGSSIVPFGSHEINTFPWQTHFAAAFREIGDYIKANNLQDAKDKRSINADAKLLAVFGKPQVTMFELAGIAGKHLS